MKALPFSRQITPANEILCFFGGHEAWSRAKQAIANGLAAVVLPVGEQPSAYDWSIVRGCVMHAIEVSETSRAYQRSIVTYAAKAGAVEVYAVSASDYLVEDPYFVGAY